MNTGANGTNCYTNWAIEILPFLEQSNLYRQYDQNQLNEHKNNRAVTQSRVPTYECPSDINAGKLEQPASGPNGGGSAGSRGDSLWMHGSYRGVTSRLQSAIAWGSWDTFEPQYWPTGQAYNSQFKGILHATGVRFNGPAMGNPSVSGVSLSQMGSPERIANITDGTSNTLMVGENTFNDVTRRATFWAFTYASYSLSAVGPQSFHFNNRYGDGTAGSGCYTPTTLYGDQMCKRAFGSNHTNGANFCMGDGSVRYIPNAVDMNLLGNMATIAGGETNLVN